MSAPAITNRDDPRYAGVIARRCRICQAKPGVECRNTVSPGHPLPGRLIHAERMGED